MCNIAIFFNTDVVVTGDAWFGWFYFVFSEVFLVLTLMTECYLIKMGCNL